MCYGVRGEVRGQPHLMVFAFCFASLLLFDAVDTRVAGLGASHLTIGPLEWQMLPSLYPWVWAFKLMTSYCVAHTLPTEPSPNPLSHFFFFETDLAMQPTLALIRGCYITCFPRRCDKILDRSNLKKEGFICAYSLSWQMSRGSGNPNWLTTRGQSGSRERSTLGLLAPSLSV